jgi:hypothetical protein
VTPPRPSAAGERPKGFGGGFVSVSSGAPLAHIVASVAATIAAMI